MSVTENSCAEARPVPVAVRPGTHAGIVEAIVAAGGEVTTDLARARGLVWLDPHDASGLVKAVGEAPELEWVQLPFAGVDAFRSVLSPDLVWTSAKGAYSEPVAEFALTLLLAALRGLGARARATSWGQESGTSLYDRDVVIVGAGGIGRELARLLEPFRCRVTFVRRRNEPVAGAVRTVTSAGLSQVLPTADAVVLAAASTQETRSLIGAEELRAMKRSAVLVNVARGALVDTDALVKALEGGWIAGAALDVTDPEPLPDGHPLWGQPRALVTPHTADTPEMCAPLLADRVRRNVKALAEGSTFVGVVDVEAGY